MRIGPCRINCSVDYREDFQQYGFGELFERYNKDLNLIVRLLGKLGGDVFDGETWAVYMERLCALAGLTAREDRYVSDWLEMAKESPKSALNVEKEYMSRIAAERADTLDAPVQESTARAMLIFVTLHVMAQCEARPEDWDALLDCDRYRPRRQQKWLTGEKDYDLSKEGVSAFLPYFAGAQSGEEEPLEIVCLHHSKVTPVTVGLKDTSISRRLYKGQRLYALRKGALGYTGFLGLAGGNAPFKRQYGCVRFAPGEAAEIDFGNMDAGAAKHYRMPCMTEKGLTAFIGENNRIYRMAADGACAPISEQGNVLAVEACALPGGKCVMIDKSGDVVECGEGDKGKTIAARGCSLAVHKEACCVVLANETGGGRTLKTIGMSLQEEHRAQKWFAENRADALQTGMDKNGAAQMEYFTPKGVTKAYV